ncbi:MAG: L-lactate dehydrogenase (quinone) large subunit LdhH [Peptococcaceae bacterium]
MPIDGAFKVKINKALNDPNLRGALGKFGDSYPESRANVYQGIDFEELRTVISSRKAEAGSKFEVLAEQFEANVVKRGGKVHRAADGNAVFQILKQIARTRNATKLVKSKSMASEEIHLNQHMADTLEMVETDLGEWIIQQINEKPSHMVMPAIHLSKERCAEIFSQALGYEVEPDIPAMVKLARRTLRDHFMTADIGLSGCNVAVAETGTMAIFTNEGNARLTATLPPVHVILVGYEKLVENFKDIAPIAKALPKSATAQTLTSYVTMISGPAETLKDKTGPEVVAKELHVILLDNGRKELLNDPVFKEAGQCIRCASCLNVCPVYQLVGGHVFGHIYAGGIGSLLTAFFNSFQDTDKVQEMCIGCGRCDEFCPGKIKISKLILEMRNRVRKQIPLPGMQNFIVGSVLKNKGLFQFGLRQASWASAPFTAKGKDGNKYIRSLPFGFKKLADWRSLPGFSAIPFRDRIKTLKQDIVDKKGKIAFFGGCVIDYAYPEIGESVVRVLNKEGYEVVYPDQTCCGAPAIYMGRQDVARDIAKQNIDQFAREEFAYIVSACPTCTAALKEKWLHVLAGDKVSLEKAEMVAAKSLDFIKLMHTLKKQKGGAWEEAAATCDIACPAPIKVTYHDSCHLNRGLGVKAEPREMLEAQAHLEFVEMEESDRCCGFGGSYCIKLPEISSQLLDRKLKNVDNSRAEIVAVDCPGCLMSLRGGLDTKKSEKKVFHTAQLLDGKY